MLHLQAHDRGYGGGQRHAGPDLRGSDYGPSYSHSGGPGGERPLQHHKLASQHQVLAVQPSCLGCAFCCGYATPLMPSTLLSSHFAAAEPAANWGPPLPALLGVRRAARHWQVLQEVTAF